MAKKEKGKMLALAIALTADAFKDDVDRGGSPYILHCLRVMNGVKDVHSDRLMEDILCAAVMHDMIEDEKITEAELYGYGFSRETVTLVSTLTHNKKHESWETYIERVAEDVWATNIKLADLRDNSDITRLKGLRKKDFDRLKKYHLAYVYLNS